MILIDYRQLALANIFKYGSSYINQSSINEAEIRLTNLKTIANIRKKFAGEYTQTQLGLPIIFCMDPSPTSKFPTWREKYFPEYKWARKQKKKEKSSNDHDYIDSLANTLFEEMASIYPSIQFSDVEADDVIATIIRHRHEKIESASGRLAPAVVSIPPHDLIVSADKDFIQLHSKDVKQWSPVGKEYVSVELPVKFLKERIIRGDSTDGIPNILSDNDTFANESKRQKRITEKMIDQWMYMAPKDICTTPEIAKNYERNLKLTAFEYVPEAVQIGIMGRYAELKYDTTQTVQKLDKYFQSKGISDSQIHKAELIF